MSNPATTAPAAPAVAPPQPRQPAKFVPVKQEPFDADGRSSGYLAAAASTTTAAVLAQARHHYIRHNSNSSGSSSGDENNNSSSSSSHRTAFNIDNILATTSPVTTESGYSSSSSPNPVVDTLQHETATSTAAASSCHHATATPSTASTATTSTPNPLNSFLTAHQPPLYMTYPHPSFIATARPAAQAKPLLHFPQVPALNPYAQMAPGYPAALLSQIQAAHYMMQMPDLQRCLTLPGFSEFQQRYAAMNISGNKLPQQQQPQPFVNPFGLPFPMMPQMSAAAAALSASQMLNAKSEFRFFLSVVNFQRRKVFLTLNFIHLFQPPAKTSAPGSTG